MLSKARNIILVYAYVAMVAQVYEVTIGYNTYIAIIMHWVGSI